MPFVPTEERLGLPAELNRTMLLSPAMLHLWDSLNMGVVIIDANGIVNYMNDLQKRIDNYENIPVTNRPVTELYLTNQRKNIPIIDCLKSGKPFLKKAYWYKTLHNELINSINDYIPLFDNGKIDGVINFSATANSNQKYAFLNGSTCQHKKDEAPVNGHDGLHTFRRLIGEDSLFTEAVNRAKAAAVTDCHVMLWGETGSGKECFAQSIHSASDRCDQPFIPVNCAAIPENLLEAMLFGTSKGAFTDSHDKPGLFEHANFGTLLLDELDSMPIGLQAKLLRVIQEGKVRRLGALKEIDVDVRVISTLGVPPLTAIEKKKLRMDLYYRIAIIGFSIPPLRLRKNDVPLLAEHFLQKRSEGKKITFSEELLQMFAAYNWPGNVRELLHVIEGSLAVLDEGNVIDVNGLPAHFLEAFQQNVASAEAPSPAPATHEGDYFSTQDMKTAEPLPLKELLKSYEEEHIREALRISGYNVAAAARLLQVTPSTLHYRIKILGIE